MAVETGREAVLNDKTIKDALKPNDLEKHIVESFVICGNPEDIEALNYKVTPILKNEQIFSLIRFCGGSTCLTKEECFILLKKIHTI